MHNVSRFQYRDPLIGVLDYIAEVGAYISAFTSSVLIIPQKKCPNNTVAIAHDDDLRYIRDVVRLAPVQNARIKTDNVRSQDILNADTVEGFLRQNETSVIIKNGGICPLTLQVTR